MSVNINRCQIPYANYRTLSSGRERHVSKVVEVQILAVAGRPAFESLRIRIYIMMHSPEAFLPVFTQRALEATSGPIVDLCKSDEPQTPRVSVTVVRIPAWVLGSPSLALKRPKDI